MRDITAEGEDGGGHGLVFYNELCYNVLMHDLTIKLPTSDPKTTEFLRHLDDAKIPYVKRKSQARQFLF